MLVLANLGLSLTSCGEQGNGDPADYDHVPITDRALAVVAAKHLREPSRVQVEEAPYGLKHPIPAAHMRYPVPSEGGDLVTDRVGTGLDPRLATPCRPKQPRGGGCFTRDGVQVTWYEYIPPGGPGRDRHRRSPRRPHLRACLVRRTSITGDSRSLDLSVSFDGLIALAQDARMERTTSQATVDGGETLDYWTFG